MLLRRCICCVETFSRKWSVLHTDCKTVALKTQGEIAAVAHVTDEDVIHPWNNPVHENRWYCRS